MDLHYSILTPSKMLVEKDDKKIIIRGEATLAPAFYADVKSIVKWEPPYDKEEISEQEKTELIQKIIEESLKEDRIRVYFD